MFVFKLRSDEMFVAPNAIREKQKTKSPIGTKYIKDIISGTNNKLKHGKRER